MLIYFFLAVFALIDGFYDSNEVTKIFKYTLYSISIWPFINILFVSIKICDFFIILKFFNLSTLKSLFSDSFYFDFNSTMKGREKRFCTSTTKYFCTDDGNLQNIRYDDLVKLQLNGKILNILNFKDMSYFRYLTTEYVSTRNFLNLHEELQNVTDYYINDDIIKFVRLRDYIYVWDIHNKIKFSNYDENLVNSFMFLYEKYKNCDYDMYCIGSESKNNNMIHKIDLDYLTLLGSSEYNTLTSMSSFWKYNFFQKSVYFILTIFLSCLSLVPIITYSIENFKQNEKFQMDKIFVATLSTNIVSLVVGIFALLKENNEMYFIGYIDRSFLNKKHKNL